MKSIFKKILLPAIIPIFILGTQPVQAKIKPIYFIGNETNGLYRTFALNRLKINRFDTVSEMLRVLPEGAAVVITASGYPEQRVHVTAQDYSTMTDRGARLYVEYPDYVPGLQLSDVFKGRLERGVVTGDYFGEALPSMSILGMNDCSVIRTKAENPMIVYAKIAGFDHAVYGLADTDPLPVLFEHDGKLVAATALSNYSNGRYGPAEHWKAVINGIYSYIMPEASRPLTEIITDPYPSFPEGKKITAKDRKESIRRGTEWLWNARLLIHPLWERDELPKYQPKDGDPNLFFGPAITDDFPMGDGCRGIAEGHASNVYADGTQQYRYFVRADVQGESSFLLAAAAKVLGEERYSQTAAKLIDYLFYSSLFKAEERNDKNNPAYGLISWANTHPGTFFNDDNARCILGVIGASSMMDSQRWNKEIVENILANYRTCSSQGFQGNAIRQEDLEANGWKHFHHRDYINPHPHFESWMWACYLWLYDKTGFEPLLRKAKSGISITMGAYPKRWKTQNGLQQERARMILPLAWLVRVEDTPQHRQWLDAVVSDLLKSQVACGGIQEQLGSKESDTHNILIRSNVEYGHNEASLIAENGDKAADMLYTCNFSFFALNEAAHATGNPTYKEAVKNLADFLVRIQVRSDNHKDIDGAWFRAFDFGRWDYWASNADNGWGAWCTLAGWIQSWIVATEALVSTDSSYWETTENMNMKSALEESKWMLQE